MSRCRSASCLLLTRPPSHRNEMYKHLGFEPVIDPNLGGVVFSGIRIVCRERNDVFTVPLEDQKYNKFENANRCWALLSQ